MSVSQPNHKKLTQWTFLWMGLSHEPLIALYALFPFILKKGLNATALQIGCFMAIKPIVAVFAYYWQAHTHNRHPNLRKHLMVAWTLSLAPFLIFPALSHLSYLFIAASAYQLFSKAATPPFIEICKQNLDAKERRKIISLTYLASFLLSAFLGIFFGQILDLASTSWQIASAFFALLALTSLYFQKRLFFTPQPYLNDESVQQPLLGPLKKSLLILKASPDFQNFQLGFMIGGSALMLIGPALIIYCTDNLGLGYKSYTQARYIFMSIGIILSTYLWKKVVKHYSLNRLMPWVSLLFGLFPLFILIASVSLTLLNSAFIIYGVAQAGSHLIWTLSPTYFSGNQNSAPYTALNILTQGLRGLIFPLLGAGLTHYFGSLTVLVIGSLVAFLGMFVMLKKNRNQL